MIGVGNGAVGVGEERERKVELLSIVLMRLHGGGVDGQDGRVGCVELNPVVPQGLELAVSTRCVVSAVEDQQDVLLALEAAERNVLSVSGFEGEAGRFFSYG